MRVPDWLRQRAEITPERLAVLSQDQTWTFADLDRRVDAAAAALRDLGIRAGQRVGLLAPNSAAYVVAVHALMRVGTVLVPINTRLSAAEIEWQLKDAELQHVLDQAALQQLLQVAPEQRIEREFDLEEWHSIIYTSGTTGRPKGAILTYANHWWSAVASALNLGLLPDDRWLACLPMFHVGGLSILLRSVVCGMAVVVHERFEPELVNGAIDEQGVTIVSVVSAMLDRMLRERGERPYPPTLRCVLLGGGPAPLPLLERAIRARAPVVQTYGLTETASQVVTLPPEDAVRKLGSAGKALMGSQVRIAADGEICVRGPTVSPGYLRQPPRQGWLHTGDLGYLDDDGYLYVLDRRDDLIISGGENIYPAEVEAALVAHPAVKEAGVIGLPDAEWGQVVGAVVALEPGSTASAGELVAFCRQRLAGYKVPRRIAFREQLPRNAGGKLLRRELHIDGYDERCVGLARRPTGLREIGMQLTSSSFNDGDYLAMDHVLSTDYGFGCSGGNTSPQLAWSGAPEGTRSFAVTCYDPDAPTGSGFWHWVVVNIPANVSELPLDAGNPRSGKMPGGALQTRTDLGAPGYGGPCPPQGDHPHRYVFTVFAVGVEQLPVNAETSAAVVGFQLHFNTLAKADLMGLFKR